MTDGLTWAVAVCLLAAGASRAAAAEPEARRGENPAEALELGEELEVVGTTPVPGLGTALEGVPASVQSFGAKALTHQRPRSAADFLERNAASVAVSAGQGNPSSRT